MRSRRDSLRRWCDSTGRPRRTGAAGGAVASSPAVANAAVYIGSEDGSLYAFSAAGTTGCSGTPKTCQPLWTGATGGLIKSSPAVANGAVYVGSEDDNVYAFRATGSVNCSGMPKTCAPLWSAATGGFNGYFIDSSPAVANGVLYIGSEADKVYAFSAAGTIDCSGTPKTCTPLWTGATGGGIVSSPTVANGVVYIGSNEGELNAFGP
jgi:outer membrane protein assembly factor BamB